MSIWHPSMYGVGPDWAYDAGPPMNPIGPGLATQDEWWFRGPEARALTPQQGVVMELPAGGSITFEIACHYAFTSYGYATSILGSELDACPGPNAGPYHAGDPDSKSIDRDLVSGCALAIADVDDISKVTMDNLAIFSVQHDCVQQKMTDFEVPAQMPACTGAKCICGWFWLANNGTANFYMTAFDCAVTGSPADATAIAAPQDPVFCKDDPSSCTQGSKRPIYAYNSPSNVPWTGNDNRAGYHESWSFGTNGAQDDIFAGAACADFVEHFYAQRLSNRAVLVPRNYHLVIVNGQWADYRAHTHHSGGSNPPVKLGFRHFDEHHTDWSTFIISVFLETRCCRPTTSYNRCFEHFVKSAVLRDIVKRFGADIQRDSRDVFALYRSQPEGNLEPEAPS